MYSKKEAIKDYIEYLDLKIETEQIGVDKFNEEISLIKSQIKNIDDNVESNKLRKKIKRIASKRNIREADIKFYNCQSSHFKNLKIGFEYRIDSELKDSANIPFSKLKEPYTGKEPLSLVRTFKKDHYEKSGNYKNETYNNSTEALKTHLNYMNKRQLRDDVVFTWHSPGCGYIIETWKVKLITERLNIDIHTLFKILETRSLVNSIQPSSTLSELILEVSFMTNETPYNFDEVIFFGNFDLSTKCPFCSKPLRTIKSKQCPHCLKSW